METVDTDSEDGSTSKQTVLDKKYVFRVSCICWRIGHITLVNAIYVSKLDPVSNFLFVCFTDFDGSNFVRNLEASVANKKKGKASEKNSIYSLLSMGTCFASRLNSELKISGNSIETYFFAQ